MTKRVLPPCSVSRCEQAAGAVIKGALYCGAHAVEQLQQLRGSAHPVPGSKQQAAS